MPKEQNNTVSAQGIDIALAGATGAVGQEMLSVLEERAFPVRKIYPLASNKKPGRKVSFRDKKVMVNPVSEFDFSKAQIALFSMGGGPSLEHSPRAAETGCLVVDNSSAFRKDDEVPLVVPEVNPKALDRRPPKGIVSNPNCSTMQMLVALAPIHREVGIERLNVATYQSVSGAGSQAISEMREQTRALLGGGEAVCEKFPVPVAFNAIPHIDEFLDNGYTKEEMKVVWETHKILGNEKISVSATAVRIPVVRGHSEAVHLTTHDYLGAESTRSLLRRQEGITVVDDMAPGGYPTALTHADGSDQVFVGRIRDDIFERCGMHLWVVSDNLRKGAALNAVQIAELLAQRHL